IPTILLYEVAIWSARLVERGQERDRLAREKQEAGAEMAEKAADASSTQAPS
ncbi:twin-arginine translocase subunit TatC, partial [Mesorhizobium sp. M4A.F.Ca.ET.020.02.1.1]